MTTRGKAGKVSQWNRKDQVQFPPIVTLQLVADLSPFVLFYDWWILRMSVISLCPLGGCRSAVTTACKMSTHKYFTNDLPEFLLYLLPFPSYLNFYSFPEVTWFQHGSEGRARKVKSRFYLWSVITFLSPFACYLTFKLSRRWRDLEVTAERRGRSKTMLESGRWIAVLFRYWSVVILGHLRCPL